MAYKKFQFLDKLYDSQQQSCFEQWLLQLQIIGCVQQIQYQPKPSFVLFEGLTGLNKKNKQIKIIRQHVYTPDFKVKFNKQILTSIFTQQQLNKMFKLHQFLDYDNHIYFQVKGGYNQYGSIDMFSINQKWLYQLYKVHVQKIQPDTLFINSFVPKSIQRTNKTNVIKKKYLNIKLLNQLLSSITS